MSNTRTAQSPQELKPSVKDKISMIDHNKESSSTPKTESKNILAWVVDDNKTNVATNARGLTTGFRIVNKDKKPLIVEAIKLYTSEEVFNKILEWKIGNTIPSIISLDNTMLSDGVLGGKIAILLTLPIEKLRLEQERPEQSTILTKADFISLEKRVKGSYSELIEKIILMRAQRQAEAGCPIRIVIYCDKGQRWKEVEKECDALIATGQVYFNLKDNGLRGYAEQLSVNNPQFSVTLKSDIKEARIAATRKRTSGLVKQSTAQVITSTSSRKLPRLVLPNTSKSVENLTTEMKDDCQMSSFPTAKSDLGLETIPSTPDTPIATSPMLITSPKSPNGFFSIAPTPETEVSSSSSEKDKCGRGFSPYSTTQ